MKTETIPIGGALDHKTAQQISEALHDVWGVRNVKVDLEQGTATISYDEKAAALQDFEQALIDSGIDIDPTNDHSVKH